ncbi:hypothetical protein IV203_009268 [Nitzschia inconspicua]|uniref:Uncharacterized protein n=1 Tax=Nitzschia inconspicua TaxID=303405 RepID=A0A9K3PQ84_9STRA|nr:hypothetical protein IV203_009268 [Nitzschia inconspicua]
MSLSMQSGTSSSDMYREILKEIGAEGSIMEYLFDVSSEEGTDVEGDSETRPPAPAARKISQLMSPGDAESDEELLHEWEAEVEDSGHLDTCDNQINHSSPSFTNGRPKPNHDWKVKLQEATIQQEQLMLQMVKLQNAQKESSPSKQKQEAEDTKHILGNSLLEVHEQPSVASPVLQEISLRNAQLQDDWQSQQKQTVELQSKLHSLQTRFHDEQTQWKHESEKLFSPARSATKIPRWEPALAKSTSKVTFVDAPSSLSPQSVKAGSNEIRSYKEEWSTNGNSKSHVSFAELQEREVRIRELEAQLGELKHVSTKQKEELDDVNDRLKDRDAEYQALLFQHEKDKKIWEDEKQDIESRHKKERNYLSKELEAANNLLQKQITLNQEQREELQKLKEMTWKSRMENMHNQSSIAIERQTQKTKECQLQTQDRKDCHDEERLSWEGRLQDQKDHVEQNATGSKNRLQEANDRHVVNDYQHLKEIQEWPDLVEMDMTKTMEERKEAGKVFRLGNQKGSMGEVGLLSPIPRDTSHEEENYHSDLSDSSIAINTVPSESMENIDNLMDELKKMGAERNAILNEINRQDADGEQVVCRNFSGSAVEDCPQPVDTPQSSPRNQPEADSSNDILNMTSDSAVLDRTLSLLNNLKDLISSNGDMNKQEASVLEHLEVLSELMQEQSSYQTLLSSPTRGQADSSEMNVEVSRDHEHETAWTSTAQASMDPWPALVSELTSRCEFLERDRRELARITEEIIKKERESHIVEIEVAVATAGREANEKLHQQTQEYNRTLGTVYQSLCYRCQQCVYSML